MTTNAMNDDQHSCFRLAIRAGALMLLLATPALTGFQCGGGPDSPESNAGTGETIAVDGVPTDLRIIVGSGGGFTGRWEGYLIEADGQVWSWSGIGVPTDTTRAGTIPPDSLNVLWQEIQKAAVFTDSTAETGNVTAALEVTANGETQRSTWIPSVEQLEPPKSPVEAVYRRARHLAAGASL